MTLSTKTLSTGRNPNYPACVAQDRLSNAIYVDGMSRGLVWDGMATAMVPLGIDPPTAAPTLTDSSGGTTYTYYTGYRFVDTSGNTWVYSALSPLASTASGATTGVTYTSNNLQTGMSRVDRVEFFRSTAGQQITLYQTYLTGFTASISATANLNGYAQFSATGHGYQVGDWMTTNVTGYTGEQYVILVIDDDTFVTSAGYVSTGSGTATQRVYSVGHNGSWTSIASDGGGSPKCRFTLAAGHNLGVGARILVAVSSVGGYNTTHQITAVTKTTFDTDVAYSADESSGGTWQLVGEAEALADTVFTDTSFSQSHKLPILNPDGSPNARRQGVPPNWMSVVQLFQDRAVYSVVMEYTVGTITTNGTRTVTGSGTSWTSDMVGRYLAAEDESRTYKITAVASATSLSLELAAATSASQNYSIIPHPTENAKLYWSYPDESESVYATDNTIVQDNTADPDSNTAIAPYGAACYVYQVKHLYRVTWAKQPQVQANSTLVASRGCINQRCWKQYEGSLYALDNFGAWQYDIGGGWGPLSPPIQDLFREGDLDWTKSRWWWCEVNPEEEVIRWFVNFSDANYTKPNRAICYHLRTKDWWTESYVHELSGGCLALISGRYRCVRGGQNEQLYLAAEGTTDGVTSAASHTATGGTTTTATGSSLGSSINCSIAFVTGSNRGLVRRITANNGSTITFTPALSTAVASGDKFIIGGIAWNLKTGLMPFPDSMDVEKAEEAITRGLRVTYQPTTNEAYINVRVFRDHATSASSNQIAVAPGTGVETSPSSADHTINIKRSRTALGDDPGTKLLRIEEGRLDPYTDHNRWIAWELRGIQGADQIEVLEAEAHGVG